MAEHTEEILCCLQSKIVFIASLETAEFIICQLNALINFRRMQLLFLNNASLFGYDNVEQLMLFGSCFMKSHK